MGFFTKTELRIFLIFWIIFSVFATSDRWRDNSALDLTRAIVDEHRFEIDSYANNTGDRGYYNGHYYSDRVPGAAFLAVPLYEGYKLFVGEIPYYNSLDEDNPSWKYHLFLFLAISLLSATFGALTVVLVYKISKYFTSNRLHRNLIVIILGLGTLLPHAGRMFDSHATSTFFIFLSFYLVFKMKKEKTDNSLFAGLAGGFAVLVEYRVIIILVGLFIIVLALKKWQWTLKFASGALVFYLLLLLYNYAIYDSPFEDVKQHLDVSSEWENRIKIMSCGRIPTKEVRDKYVKGVITPIIFIRAFNFTNLRILRVEGIHAARMLIDPFRGLFFYFPIMLFSLLGLFFMHKEYKTEVLIMSFCFVIYLVHLSRDEMWWAGLSFGPRYLTPFTPFFMILLLYVFKKISIKIVLFFITISILITLIGLQPIVLSYDPIVFSDSYCKKMESFAPLANPLFKNYIPSLLNYQPRNLQNFLILERLLGFRIVPFANIILLLLAFLLIWKNRFIFKN